MNRPSRYRWFVVSVFFFFMLLHQTDQLDDRLDAGAGHGRIPAERHPVGTDQHRRPVGGHGALPGVGLPVRSLRPRQAAGAGVLHLGRHHLAERDRSHLPAFLATRASTGIDNSAYPGLYSLIADYFPPSIRGRVYGLLQLAQPLGYLLGMILALMVAPLIGGWRAVFYLTGTLGLVIAVVIFFGVREMPRGRAEPELEGVQELRQFRFSWAEASLAVQKRTMWFLFAQGFAGVFPWNVITFFFFGYLIRERGYDNDSVLFTMAPVILILAAGYFVGGALGDFLFRRTLRGRVIISCTGVLLGAVFLFLAMRTPVEERTTFFILMCLTAIFMPMSSANVIATIYDVTLPEVRSTTMAVEYLIENSGAALAPLLTGIIADALDLQTAILSISLTAWLLCFVIYLGALDGGGGRHPVPACPAPPAGRGPALRPAGPVLIEHLFVRRAA